MDSEKTVLLNYVTEEHAYYHRSVDFYWALGLIALAIAVLAFILKDGLFGILILIGAGLYGYSSWKKPQEVSVVITDKDISFGEDIYPMDKIAYFRVMDIKGEKELVLNIRRTYHPVVSISIPDGLDAPVREVLSPMVEENTSLVPHIGRRFMARFKV